MLLKDIKNCMYGKSEIEKLGYNRLLWLILILAVSVRVWGISFGLPGIDHGDESEVVNHAVRFGSGDFNPHRFVYGTLVQYLLFFLYGVYFILGYAAGRFSSVHDFALYFVQDPTVFHLIARMLSAVFGTATVYLAYRIGARIANKKTGLLSAFVLAIAFEPVVHSHYGTVDTALVFFFTLAVYCCCMVYEQGRWRDYLFAGFTIGLAGAVKYNGIFAVLPLLLAHFFRKDGSAWSCFPSQRLWAAAGCIILGHAAACPFFYFEIPTVLREITQMRALHAAPVPTILAYLTHTAFYFWGIPLGALCLIGMLEGIRKNREKLVIVLTAACILAFASLHRYVEAKYVLHAFPLLAVCGATLLVRLIGEKRPALISAAACLLSLHSLFCVITWDSEHARTSITLEAKRWIEQNLPVNAKILLDNVGNAGPKLENSPANYRRQYDKAARNKLMKADYLKLKSELNPPVYYDITLIDCAAGSISDDYKQYSSWQDLETPGLPVSYYRERGFQYIILTERYIPDRGGGLLLIKEFNRKSKAVHVYAVPP